MLPPGPFAELKEQLDRFGVAPELLTIEITELAVLEASPRLRQRLVLLRQRGIRIRVSASGWTALVPAIPPCPC